MKPQHLPGQSKPFLPALPVPPVPPALPILLAYPRIYQRLIASDCRGGDFKKILDKCCQLARSRPPAQNRHGGFFGMGGSSPDKQLALFTIWADADDKPDIFIMAGHGDGFGPGHTCPAKQELRQGIYGDLIPVPFF